MRSILSFGLLLLLLGSFSAAMAAIPEETSRSNRVITTAIPSELSVEKATEAVLMAGLGRQWTVVQREPGYVELKLVHRKHDAQIFFYISDGSIRGYCEAYRRNKDGSRGKPDLPEGWIKNLERDIPRFLQQQAVLSN